MGLLYIDFIVLRNKKKIVLKSMKEQGIFRCFKVLVRLL